MLRHRTFLEAQSAVRPPALPRLGVSCRPTMNSTLFGVDRAALPQDLKSRNWKVARLHFTRERRTLNGHPVRFGLPSLLMDKVEIKEDEPGQIGLFRHILQMLRVCLAALAFSGFAIGAPFVGFILPLLSLGGGTPLERRKRCQRAVGLSFRLFHAFMRIAGLIDFRPTVRLPRSSTARIVVANHPSLVDVTAILASEPELCCVVKPEVFANPLYRLIVTYCGHMSSSGSGSGGKNVGELIAERLEEGSDVLIFPEGTRTAKGEIGPFHAGAFGLAILYQRSIVPLAVFCSQAVLKRGTPWYLIPVRPVTLKFTPLSPVEPLEDETSRGFAGRVREELLQFLKTNSFQSTQP